MSSLVPLDWSVIIFYFVLVYGIAFWSVQRKQNVLATATNYFLAGRNIGWFIIGASLFASNIGSEHLVGLAGTAAASGVAVGHFEILASLILLLLGWFFVPFYLKSGVYTMPEFLERRYSPAARWYLAVISIVGYVLTKISVTIAAGAIVMEVMTGVNFWTAALIVVIATGIYTIFGGLRAVLYTDMIQMFVFVGGAITITWIGLGKIGGWGAMHEIAGPGFMNMWKPISDPNFPWTGIIFGAPILAVWYWCTDQFIVQRVLSAQNIDQARSGTIFAGYLKILPLFIFVIPGVLAYCLMQKGVIYFSRPDQALPTLVASLLPDGLRGLVVAGLLAALMSSLSSVFNSCSTLVTMDIYKKFHPEATEKHLVWVGQLSTVVLVILGILWIPFMKLISAQIYQYLQSVQAYISPPIAAVFLIGLLWPRMNAAGALTALLGGFILGMGRLILELNKTHLVNIHGLYYLATINFLHFAILLFIVCSVLLILVSLLTAKPAPEKLTGLTVETTVGAVVPKTALWRRGIWFSLGLVVIVACVWLYFTG